MFKNIYTTRMSGNSKVLEKRFEKISRKPIKFKKLTALVCAIVILSVFTVGTIVMAEFDNESQYTLEITNNGEAIIFENKPIIENGEVYVPLREIFTKLGFMASDEAEILWNDGEILLELYEKSLNEDAVAEFTVYAYKMEIGKSELVINPEALVPRISPDEITSVVEPMNNAPVLKNNVTYIPFSYAERIVERADVGFLSPPDRYNLEFIYSGEKFSIMYPLSSVAKITNKFGKRVHPITGEEQFHTGIDFDVPVGTGVYAGIDGVITQKAFDEEKGNYVTVSNKLGVEVTYNHLSAFGSVYTGMEVEKLTLVGYSGNTGASTGAHLHMEVKINGEYIDPELCFEDNDYWEFYAEIDAKLPEILETAGYPNANYDVIDIDYGEEIAFVRLKISKYEDRDVYDDKVTTVLCTYFEPQGWTGVVLPESNTPANHGNVTEIDATE